MQENVLSIATNSSILSVNRLYKTFEDNMLYKSKHISQIFQHCKHMSLCHSYRIMKSSTPHFLRDPEHPAQRMVHHLSSISGPW